MGRYVPHPLSLSKPSRRRRLEKARPLVAALGFLSLTACDALVVIDGPLPEPDAEPEVAPEPDSEPEVSPEPDAEPEVTPEPDVEPEGPVRTVHERLLMGGMPVHNRFLDPWITQTAAGWIFLSGNPFQYPTVGQVQLPGSPMGAPAAHIDKAYNPDGVEAFGAARSSSGALSVSVWIGRHEGAGDPGLQTLDASLLGVFEGDGELATDLTFDSTAEPILADGLVWMRYQVALSEGPIGWAYLHVTDNSDDDLYIAAPVMVATSSVGFSAAASASAVKRPLSEAERRGLDVIRTRMRDHLSAPRVQESFRRPTQIGPLR
jgi:hypothetical protein